MLIPELAAVALVTFSKENGRKLQVLAERNNSASLCVICIVSRGRLWYLHVCVPDDRRLLLLLILCN